MGIKKKGNLTQRMATFIVDKRGIIFLLYICVFIFCIIAMGWVNVESDVTKYLSEDTETRQGIDAMNENFATFATAKVMVSNVTYETAEGLYQQISKVDGVTMAVFDNTTDHYRDATALIDINFAGGNFDEQSISAMDQIQNIVENYDTSIYSAVGVDENAVLDGEMTVILMVAVVIIIVVLVLTSRSYMEVPVLLMTFGAAALLNMGTNFMLGTISFISDSVAVVLQLALAIDYAIILCHRFSDEFETKSARDAAISALSKAIPEISASSLTTISGLAALGFMDFGIGLDMAMVLIKAIFLSMVSVFTLMPGLLVLFSGALKKTKHKKLLPNITLVGKFAVKARFVLPFLFLIALGAGFWLSNQCPFTYSYTNMKTAKMTELQTAYFKIDETFGNHNMVAILVPAGDYEAEAAILQELEGMEEVKSTMGLSGTEAMGGYKLTDALTPRQFAELIDMDYEVAQALYTAYATQGSQIGQLLGGIEEYKIPLFDLILFVKDLADSNHIDLGNLLGESGALLGQLEMAKDQMQSENYSRMVVYLNLPEEGEETFQFLQTMRNVIGKYYEDDYYLVGNSTSSRDLSDSFAKDNLMISLLSIFFVVLVLLFTFRSAGLPVLLIAVIQGSIWINYSFPTITNTPLYFLGYLIVSAIQMGANIDYAIVMSSHYQEKKRVMPHKQAIVEALNAAFPTVFTSGTIMASAGLLIGNMSAQPVIAILGTCIGRGTIISMFLVLFVLPSILVLGDSIIERTRFKFKGFAPQTQQRQGNIRVSGHVRGRINGIVDAHIEGTVYGQMDAMVSVENEEGEQEDA